MDVRMPRIDGIEATRQIVARSPETRVVALTTFDLDEYVYAAVRAGASGFLLKDVSPDDLVHAVGCRRARRRDARARRSPGACSSGTSRRPLPGTKPDRLAAATEREVDVLRLVAQGRSNAEIAAELYLSEATVKTYVSRLLTKLDLRDRVQLTVLAYQCGIVAPGDGSAPGR